jgi:methylthioribulose-1-phosphate dehydratase
MSTQELKEQIAETIRHYNDKGWSPATSTNYSFRDEEGTIWVSRSGIDKYEFHADDFITVNSDGQATGAYEGGSTICRDADPLCIVRIIP